MAANPLLSLYRMLPDTKDRQPQWLKDLPWLGLIWLVGAVGDRLWFALDRAVPAWDQAGHLTGALNYWQALNQAAWLSGDWWQSFWMLSSRLPPFTYILTAPFLTLFGAGPEQSTLVNLLCSAILLTATYGLGLTLFSRSVGLWAAGLCLLFPGLCHVRLSYLTDYPLAAMVSFSFFCLTYWYRAGGMPGQSAGAERPPRLQGWLAAMAFGVSFGLALLTKQTALPFLLPPLAWVGIACWHHRAWGRLSQLLAALGLALLVCFPWYRLNWLLMLSGGRVSLEAGRLEGDPPLNTLAAWTYYLQILPDLVSWPLLIGAGAGLLYYWRWGRKSAAQAPTVHPPDRLSILWLLLFWLGAYLLNSANLNKDDRYVMPYLPVVAVLLAQGLLLWPHRYRWVRWGTIGLTLALLLVNLFPLLERTIPYAHQADLGPTWPHQQVIAEVIRQEPYQTSTIAVLPSTVQINQHNINYFGALEKFQVYGRQVGTNLRQATQESQLFSWFLTKTAEQGNIRRPKALFRLKQLVETEPDLELHRTWTLPDYTMLRLYHRRQPSLEVRPLAPGELTQVRLEQITVPAQAPPGQPLPVTYQWAGPWEALRSGLVLLTWTAASGEGDQRWFHDHGIGLGTLPPGPQPPQATAPFQVVERLAMLPPPQLPSGTYRLQATYVDRKTGESYPISTPAVQVQILPQARSVPAPELDRVTQLAQVAASLPHGPRALTPIFDRIGYLNQYDPTQDYLEQARQAWTYRLGQEPQNRDLMYGLALTHVLRRRSEAAITTFGQLAQLDRQNPYAHAYLAFVNLYSFRPGAAQAALQPAFALQPNLPELKALRGVAALMQGNLVQAWQDAQAWQTIRRRGRS